MIKEHNETIESDRKRMIELIKVAGFNDLKEFSTCEELGLKYSAVVKWGTLKDNEGKLRPVPVWVFSWLNLYIKNKELNSKLIEIKTDKELLEENIKIKESMKNIKGIIESMENNK